MPGRGIRKQVLLLGILPALLIAMLLSVYFVNSQLGVFNDFYHERGITIAEQLATSSEYGVVTGNVEMLSDLTSALLKNESVVGVTISDSDGMIVHAAGETLLIGNSTEVVKVSSAKCRDMVGAFVFCAPILQTRLDVVDYDENFSSSDMLKEVRTVLGVVYVKLTNEIFVGKRNAIITQVIFFTLLMLLLAGMLAAKVAVNIARPIENVTGAVRRAERGDLSLRIKDIKSGEIGALQVGINKMMTALQENQFELTEQINEATSKLRAALRELEVKNVDLECQRKQAEEASTAKSRFLANMSHEIRTPLSGIVGMLDLLSDTNTDQQQRIYVNNLDLATRSLKILIEDILDISRIEAGKLTLITQTINACEIIDEVVTMLAPQAHAKGLEVICHVSEDFPEFVESDPIRFRQVLINLVVNAIKYTDRGEVYIKAYPISASNEGKEQLRFEVHDTGVGIPHEKIATIFESFTRIDESNTQSKGGSGLGTTISRELVHLMDGEIGVESQLGKGSCFWFELPLQVVEGQRTLECQQALRENLSVYVLEKNAHQRDALHSYATKLGVVVKAYETESELVAALDKMDVVAENLVMFLENSNQSSYIDTAKRIRTVLGESAARLCHATFYNGMSDSVFDSHISKPITLRSLYQTLCTFTVEELTFKDKGATGTSLSELHILVAEDNTINALAITSFLTKLGHKFALAENGIEAVEKLKKEKFDLVFMDMRMPEMDGLEATRKWRMLEGEAGHIPIIALTANATMEDKNACIEAGMDDFMSKPIGVDQITEIVGRFTRGEWRN